MKKALSMLLVLVMLFGVMPMTALPARAAETESVTNELAGKTVSILGDSISTFGGVSNNANSNSTIGSNATYYSGQGGITRADTWWQQTIDVLDMELLVNNSWSGSCVFQPRKGEASVGYTDRCVNLHNDRTGEEPDVILVFLGTNDYKSQGDTLGTEDDVNYDAIITDNGDGTYTYATAATTCEAYAIMLHKMSVRYPNADIYCMSLLPRKNSPASLTKFNQDIAVMAERFGCSFIDLEHCGITPDAESMEKYMYDGKVHPNSEGMDLMSQAVVSALTGKNTIIRDIEMVLTNVASDNNEHACIDGESFITKLTSINPKEKISVTITMGSEDITASAYNNGNISIEHVTGDVKVVASAERGDITFRWDYSDGELVNTVNDEYAANALVKQRGSANNGVFEDTYYRTQHTVKLLHDKTWTLEWRGSGSGGFMLSDATSAASSTVYFRRHTTGYLHVFGMYDGNKYNHYGVKPGDYGIDVKAVHTYRMENRVNADGTNMVYLFVDGAEIGAMNNYYVGYVSQGTTDNWISGKDFCINYIGSSTHPLDAYSMEYLQICEGGHTHSYASSVTAPTCTEQGYTTYTCECGDSYVSDYVDATDHTYKNGICTGCGEEDYDGLDLNGLNVLCLGDSITAGQGLTTETRWTNVLASKYGWNLTNKSQGGISLSSYYYTANGKSNVSIAKKAEILKTMTTKPDVIIVWGGHNDTSYRYSPLGTWDDETTDSFKGALKYIAELADEYAPDATLFVLTPLWTTEAPSTLKVPENTTDNNWMFVDAIYEGAEAYGWIPVNMDLCGITPFTKSGLLLDNIHPNEAGTEKIVAYLSAELASYSETSKKETIIFNASAVSMKPGESTTLKAVLSPRSGTGTMTFTWSSSDSSVATVDTSGKITAVAPGTAVITATAPNGISADISVSAVCEHTYENGTCTGCGAVSEESVANGTCGDALTWMLDKNGVLTISGTGEMYDYGFRAEEEIVVNAPWTAYKNEITKVVLEEGVTNIGQAAFEGCANLKSVVFSEDITDIGNQAFSNCVSLETVTLPESLSSIGEFAFNGCSSMESIRIPAGVTTIGSHAFSNCSGLTMVEIPSGVAQISERLFNGCSSLTAVKIPAGVTGIGDYAFFGCKSLETAELPDGLASIGEYAFGDCVALTGIVLPESLVSIGNSAFSTCSSLTEIILPAAVENLGNSVFYNCYNLRNVSLPANLESIGEWVFYGCGLTSIDIPDGVTGIGPYAFYSCDYLTSVEIPDSVTSVGEHAFCDCIRLTSIKLPKGLASIGNSAFGHCKSLAKITFTGDAPAIAESAFANVTATVLYPSNNATWSADACQNYGANALTWTAYCNHTYENGTCTGCGAVDPDATEPLPLRYDDHYDVTGKTVEIIDAGTPTSYQVGYGVEENKVLDTAVVTLKGNTLVATGIGTAKVKIDGALYEVTVEAAPISLLLLIGQSNMRGSEGNANQSIVCPDGMVYSTYGDDRGESNTAMTASNATQFAPSALTGTYSSINVVGTTDCLSGYPVNSLTEAGAGKIGPDSGFAYEWVRQTGEKVWVVNAAHGGTSINVWQPGTTEYEQCQALFAACQETLRKEIAAGHFTLSHMAYFWCQGCSDRTQSAQWYVNKYLAMHNGLKTEMSFDHDSNADTANKTFEFGGIIPVRVGSTATCYRDGAYETTNPYSYHESYVDLRFSGPRVAQYWMCNNPELKDIWMVCNIGEDWVWMPDGTNGVSVYFQANYPNGKVDYTPQVKQSASWYTPTTPKAVHDSVHYNQIGYNEIGRESVRNALIMLGEMEAPAVETTVEFLSWDGYTTVDTITAAITGTSNTLVVPKVYPVWKTKAVAYDLSDGLTWNYYDLLAENTQISGTLESLDQCVTVVKTEPGAHYVDHLSELPENVCCGLNLWTLLEHDPEFYYSGTHWAIHGTKDVMSVTIPVMPGDKIFATAFGKAGTNGHETANGIRVTFFNEYGVAKTTDPDGTYKEFVANGGYLIVPEGATAANIPMWTNDSSNELYILSRQHDTTSEICSICGQSSHSHTWSDWQIKEIPGKGEPVTEERSCSGCGETETREVESVWQKYDLAAHYSDLPENVCSGLNLWNVLEHDKYYFANGTNWSIYSGGTVKSVTISVEPGDVIFATAWGKAGENGHATADGIRVSFFDVYGVAKTMTPAECYAEFSKNGGYLIAPEGAIAVNVAMWNNSNENELYILDRDHSYENGICTGCGEAQPGPVITQQPESVEQEIGKKFAITVKAEGEGLTYQWYVKDSGAKAFKVSSNKTASYAYTMATYMHNRQVYCMVTDANGNSVQTETATISRPPQTLKILQQPQDARVNVGEKFSISPKVEGEGLIYQWYVKENGAKAFKVSSVRGSAYALTMQKYMIGRQVYCVITDKHGNSVTTDVATISLPPVELKILEQPSDVYASKGEKFSISPKVQGEGLTYQWYYKEGYMKDFKASSNKTSAYAYSMQLYMNKRSVYCVITDKFGNQVQTEVVTIYLGDLITK